MRMQKAPPSRMAAPFRCGRNSIAVADVVDRRTTQHVTQIGQGTDDAVAGPRRILFDQLEDEFFKFRVHGRPTDRICPGIGPLFDDEVTEPTEQSVGSNDGGELSKAVPSDRLRSAGKPSKPPRI